MSVDLAHLPARTRAFLERGALEGERNQEAHYAAQQLRDAGVPEAEAVRLIQDGAAYCGLPASEARGAVKSAFKRTAREPIQKRSGDGNDPLSRPASPPVCQERAAAKMMRADKETPDQSETWRGCVAAFNDDHAAKLATWRGYSPEFVGWLRERKLIGLHKGLWAVPVHGDGGKVLAIHYRIPPKSEGERARWAYWPEGVCVRLLVIGDTARAEFVAVFESQWDLLAVADKLGVHKGGVPGWAFVATRGADNGKLLAGVLPKAATVLAFAQNDTPGRKWLQSVADYAGITVKPVVTPEAHKDAADWCKAGATVADLDGATSAAVIVQPTTETRADAAPAPLSAAIVTSAELAALAVVPRRFIVRPFFREGDLGFIYAKRGDGKTWLAMLLAKAAATGGAAGPWHAEGVWPVLYVDGEMPAEESKRRDSILCGASENLAWLHHEIFFDRTGKTLNLTNPATQAELTALLVKRAFKMLVLDNLSCLFTGVKENDADAWELVLPWLLELRRRKIAIVIVAHAGRNGLMRGTSRREDAAFWVLKLERQDSDDPLFRGLRFTSLFTKNRNALEDDCPPLEWTVVADGDGPATVTAKTISGVELLVSWVRAGLDSATDIAAEMGISKGQVSKLAKRAERLGLLVIEARHYRPTADA
jgi:putative DNA primase/helicase